VSALPGDIAIAGWVVRGDYAHPVAKGGGCVELGDDGVLEVSYETNWREQELGLDDYLVTRVPVEVLRAVIRAYDAKREGGK